MKPTLALQQAQRLRLTPELRLALGLLQLSGAELAAKVQEALDSNMLLERGDEPDATEDPGENSASEQTETPIETLADWDSAEPMDPSGTWDGDEEPYPHRAAHDGAGLKEHLLWQLELARLNPRDAAIGAALIDSLNDDGYLTESLEELRLSLMDSDAAPEPEEMEAVLHRIQAFDPPGVAARDLRECLLLQLRLRGSTDAPHELARRLVSDHLESLASHDHAGLSRRLGLSLPELAAAIERIRSLQPRPGSAISAAPVDYVIPEVLVHRRDQTWAVELNAEAVPRIRLNAAYAAALSRRGDTQGGLGQQLQEARWLIRSLRMRNETLLRVAKALVHRQQAFFEGGDEAMRPLLMKDLAVQLELHESTVSRVVANKHMMTPRGLFPFRHFFSSELSTEDGGACSSTAIRAMIKKLVAQENPRAPLSDNHISRELLSRGIRVARRTVAKYRESLTIPPAHERRRLDGGET